MHRLPVRTLVIVVALAVASLSVAAAALTLVGDRSERPGASRLLPVLFNFDGGIYSLQPEGSSFKRLAEKGERAQWSSDGTHIAFHAASSDQNGNGDVYVMKSDGSGLTGVTADESIAGSVTGFSWSPDGKQIALIAGADLYIVNIDGSGLKRLTNDRRAKGRYRALSWSPDGSRIAFIHDEPPAGGYGNLPGLLLEEVAVINPDGSGLTRLTTTDYSREAEAIAVAWSPDGSRIAYGINAGFGINVINADGSGKVSVTRELGRQVNAGYGLWEDFQWSPDGRFIAFTVQGGPIHVVNADGTGLRKLGYGSAEGIFPAWSPDGTKIAYVGFDSGRWRIYRVNADGTDLKELFAAPYFIPTDLSWASAAHIDFTKAPPATTATAAPAQMMTVTPTPAIPETPAVLSAEGPSGRIAFHSFAEGNYEIYVIDPDGSGQTRLTDSSAQDYSPSWSPDGTRIAFLSTRDGRGDIYVMNADGSGVSRLTTSEDDKGRPAWSPDGLHLAFAARYDGNYQIHRIDADGTALTRLTNVSLFAVDPAWSPDGRRLAFGCFRDGQSDICVVNADGSGLVRLTSGPEDDLLPDWSPDGGGIAFVSGSVRREGNEDIYVMQPDGSGRIRLTEHPGQDSFPSWSPDGRHIAFVSNRDRKPEVHAMNADGSGQRRVTDNATGSVAPDWAPAPSPKGPPATPAEGYMEQPSTNRDYCVNRPAGLVCLGFDDGYYWLVGDAIAGWETVGHWEGKIIRVARGFRADYYHILGTTYVRTQAKCQPDGAQGPNLLQNPGFEAIPSAWRSTRQLTPGDTALFEVDGAVHRSGAASARGKEVAAGNLGRLFQDVSGLAVAGRCYKIGGWLRTEHATGATVIGLDYVNEAGVTPSAASYVKEVGHLSGTHDWTYVESAPFVLPPMPVGVGNVALWFLLDFNQGSGTAWWDGLFLVEIR